MIKQYNFIVVLVDFCYICCMKIVFLTGAGISAPSGIPTFRCEGGLWSTVDINSVATAEAIEKNPIGVVKFWDDVRADMFSKQPNAAHLAIAELQAKHDVVVLTQNVDDLHEKAGSGEILHLHGDILHARSFDSLAPLYIGYDKTPIGMRQNIVLFGEPVRHFLTAKQHIMDCDVFVVVGTSLNVHPVNSLLKTKFHMQKIIVDIEKHRKYGYENLVGSADVILPNLIQRWL